MFASDIRWRCTLRMRSFRDRRWYRDELDVKPNEEMVQLPTRSVLNLVFGKPQQIKLPNMPGT